MVGRLFEALQFSGRSACIDQSVGDRLGEGFFGYVMRTGKRREHTILGQKFERADVQLSITTERIAQAAFRFCERRRIENNQIILRLRLVRGAEKLENILPDELDL